MRFAKGHGTENDFVILLDPDGSEGLTAALASRLCDRRSGIGGDGVLRVVRAAAHGPARPGGGADGPVDAASGPRGAAGGGADGPVDAASGPRGGAGSGAGGLGDAASVPGAGLARPEWFMDYRNADGSVAEMCGNGIRVFARYLAQHGLAPGPEFAVATRSGPRQVRLGAVLGPGSAVIAGQAYRGLRVSVGNPHLACLVDGPLAGLDLSEAPKLDPGEFPECGNVELVRMTGPASVAMRVYERGSGETRSCGTGAVAAATAAAAASGRGDGTWAVRVPGGDLTVTLAAGRAWLTGPAVIVAEGEFDPAWLAGHLTGAGAPASR
jgi:diaminopimelate epimerase